MKSKITGGETEYLFTANILNKYPVKYYRCVETGFIQTEDAFWLKEAYESALVALDTGVCMRNEELTALSKKILAKYFSDGKKYLDYGGGYGQYVRMMRDRGFNFFLYDTYAENLFARFFSLKKLEEEEEADGKFEVITAFELFEHLEDPVKTIQELLKYTDTLMFSTELVPEKPISSPADWWYFIPETGQHLSFYTKDSLEYIAKKSELNFYPEINKGTTHQDINIHLHILTKKTLDPDPEKYLRSYNSYKKIADYFERKLLKKWKISERIPLNQQDSEFIKANLSEAKK